MASILLLLIPALILTKKYGVSLDIIGTQKGKVKFGVKSLLVSVILIFITYLGSSEPDLIQEYPLSKVVLKEWYYFVLYEISYILFYYIAYEFFFRGLMQMGINQTIKNNWNKWMGIIIVTLTTTFIHWIPMDKPTSEILGAFAVGIIFG